MTLFETQINRLCSRCKADINLIAAATKLIDNAPEAERISLFVRFLYLFRYTPTDESESVFEEFTGTAYRKDLFRATVNTNTFIDKMKDRGLCEEQFYADLLNFIQEETQNDIQKRVLYFAACARNDDLPYINPKRIMTMSSDELQSAEKQLDPLYEAMIRRVVSKDFDQITELASAYIPILELGTTEEEKALILTSMFIHFRRKLSRPPSSGLFED